MASSMHIPYGGARLVLVARDVGSVDPELVDVLQACGGFHYVRLGARNCLHAQLEVIPLSNAVATWENILARMPNNKREDAVNRVLADLSSAVAEMDLPLDDKGALNARNGLLASATRQTTPATQARKATL